MKIKTTQQMTNVEQKPIKKRRRRKDGDEKARQARMYFNQDTQAAIVKYQGTQSINDKNAIYVTDVMPAFVKLVENLINIHKFTSLHDTYNDLRDDCVNFLFETLNKFDATRGTNAFSYFNVVAKNWLIIKTKQRAQKVKKNVSIDDSESLSLSDQRAIENYSIIPSQDVIVESKNTASNIIEMMYEVRNQSKTENELVCINSIITIFENIDNIDLLNKSALLLYLRDLSGLTPKQLTTTLQNLKKSYRRLKIDSQFGIF